jgi:sphingolipid delta-4 desaturase
MARSVTATTNGASKRREPANGKANGHANGSANGAAPEAEAQVDDASYRDFFWTYTEEPHRTRRLAIIKAHPEVSLSLSSIISTSIVQNEQVN